MHDYPTDGGDLLPHWLAFPDFHPYSLHWRMGAGETFTTVFSEWIDRSYPDREARLRYFLKYPPPPRWLEVMASYLWELDEEEDFVESLYLDRLRELGFSGTERFTEDMDDESYS